jgi:glycosyltransferase involved in cell wall biosynthesis
VRSTPLPRSSGLELAEPTLDCSIVVPYYNPGPRLGRTVERMVEVLSQSPVSFEVITVSDGSTDGSEASLDGLGHDVVRRVILPRQAGKGQALRVGLAMGQGRYLGFLDADGDLSPELLAPFVALMRQSNPDIILGSKRHPQSVVSYPPLRRVWSWGYQQLIRLLFRLSVQDTQVGIKLLRRDVVAAVLPRMVERRFAFDLELFVVARDLGYHRLVEAPVRIEERFGSTISLKTVVEILADTLAVFYRLRLRHFYDPDRFLDTSDAPRSAGRHFFGWLTRRQAESHYGSAR